MSLSLPFPIKPPPPNASSYELRMFDDQRAYLRDKRAHFIDDRGVLRNQSGAVVSPYFIECVAGMVCSDVQRAAYEVQFRERSAAACKAVRLMGIEEPPY